jgi:hypothetical protein
MLKFLIISIAVIYILSKLWKYIFRGLMWLLGEQMRKQAAYQQSHYTHNGHKVKKEGEIEVQYDPQKEHQKPKKDFRGGEYVDYEEVDDK